MRAGPGWIARSARFDFVSVWSLPAGPERVWEELTGFLAWPVWWPGLERVRELAPGDPGGAGQRASSVWKGPLPYRLRFEVEATRRERPRLLEGRASGDVSGTGRWILEPAAGGCRVTMDWEVEIARPLLRALAPVARPAYRFGHDHVMRSGEAGLTQRLSSHPLFT